MNACKIILLVLSIVFLPNCISQVAPSETAHNRQEIVKTFTPSNLPSITPSLAETVPTLPGELWIHHFQDDDYIDILDLQTGSKRVMQIPSGCMMYPATINYFVCETIEGLFYLFFTDTQQRLDLNIFTPDWVTLSPGGHFLVYPFGVDDQRLELAIYNTQTNQTRIAYVQVDNMTGEYWFARPNLSYDGKYLAIGAYDSEDKAQIEIVNTSSGTSEIFQLDSFPSSPPEGDTNWAPNANRLLIGTAISASDVPEESSQVILLDLENDERILFDPMTNSAEYHTFHSNHPIWSPSGEKAVIATEKEICVLWVLTGQERCIRVDIGFGVAGSPVWSPAENYVMAYADESGPKGSLVLLDIETWELRIFLDSDLISMFFWLP